MSGERPLLYSLQSIGLLPHWIEVSLPHVDVVSSYLILVVGLLALRGQRLARGTIFLPGANWITFGGQPQRYLTQWIFW